jgi:hypothetical protein
LGKLVQAVRDAQALRGRAAKSQRGPIIHGCFVLDCFLLKGRAMAVFVPRILVVAFAGALALAACNRTDGQSEGGPSPSDRIPMTVTADGFVPARTHVKVGKPVTLLVTREVEQTCATDLVIKDYGVNRALPRGQTVEIQFTPTKKGPIPYSCAMGMVSGELTAE